MNPLSEAKRASVALAKRRLRDFLRGYEEEHHRAHFPGAWHTLEPGTRLNWNWHIDAICEHLEAVTNGEIKKLLINIPPGHMKSLLVSVAWPAWTWITKPTWRALFSSYAMDLAIRDSVKCRMVIESQWYQDNFVKNTWRLQSDQNAKSYFQNSRLGFRLAMSVGGATTGHRGDAIVVDDPLNALEAASKVEREKAIQWWDTAMSSRLNDQRVGARVIIMQRLHEDDLAGHVLRSGGYEHLCLPTEFEPNRKSRTFFFKDKERKPFWEDPRKEPGELLFPEMFPAQVVEQIKTPGEGMGPMQFAGQHQQSPVPAEGGLFKKEWWRFYRLRNRPDVQARPHGCNDLSAIELPTEWDEVLTSWDCNFKEAADNDFVCGGLWGRKGANKFLLALFWKRTGVKGTMAAIREMAAHPAAPPKHLVEDKANGSAVIEMLQDEIPGIVAVNPEGGKEARANAIAPQMEAGNVYLPDGATWLEPFIAEHASFPKGSHDDQVDMTSQALLRLTHGAAKPGARWVAYLEAQGRT